MTTKKQRPFNQRAFVALVAAASGLGLPLSGIANHLLQFEPLTVERHAWMSAHNALGVAFVMFSLWHAVLNRRALVSHLRRRVSRASTISREAIVAVTVVVGLVGVVTSHAFIAG